MNKKEVIYIEKYKNGMVCACIYIKIMYNELMIFEEKGNKNTIGLNLRVKKRYIHICTYNHRIQKLYIEIYWYKIQV